MKLSDLRQQSGNQSLFSLGFYTQGDKEEDQNIKDTPQRTADEVNIIEEIPENKLEDTANIRIHATARCEDTTTKEKRRKAN